MKVRWIGRGSKQDLNVPPQSDGTSVSLVKCRSGILPDREEMQTFKIKKCFSITLDWQDACFYI
jgi:hypothetical protein